MKNRRLTKSKALLTAVLVLVLAGGVFLIRDNAFAAAGTVTVNVANQGEWPEGTEFKFNLYKVGEYGHDSDGKAIFVLDNKYEKSGVAATLADASNYEKGEASDAEKTWTQGWLDAANTLATFINGMESDKPKSLGEKTAEFGTGGDANFAYPIETSGLYLLVGNSQEAGDTLWTPQPMFISMLDGNKVISFNNKVGVKMTSRKIAYNHNVKKQWSGDDDAKSTVRPDNIAVKIMYGSTAVDTVILSKDSDYTYSWKHKIHYSSGKNAKDTKDDKVTSIDYIPIDKDGNEGEAQPFTPKEEDAGWSVVELRNPDDIKDADAKAQAPLLRYYTTTYTPKEINEDTESFTIENEFTCKSIKLIKSIDGYDDDGSDVTFSFKIAGKDADNKVIYTNHIGVSFTKQDGLTKETVINYIPADVVSIEVSEEYSGNYELDGKIGISELTETADTEESGEDAEKKVTGWEVTANNKHGDHGPKGGIVNRYAPGEKPAADPGQAPKEQAN